MADLKLQSYIKKYGEIAAPKLYHVLQSRAAYIGATLRLRKALAEQRSNPNRGKKSSRPTESNSQPLLFEIAGVEEEVDEC